MAISVNWATRVIFVPKADTIQTSLPPNEVRQLDLNVFRLALKDLEDNPNEGITYVDTHRHQAPVSLGSVDIARVVEIINGYTVTFEDGQYAVELVGANSNVASVTNVNQVSIRSDNSAGLIQAGTGLDTTQSIMLLELWKLAGLDVNNPLVVDPLSRTAGTDINQEINKVDATDTVTVTRDSGDPVP